MTILGKIAAIRDDFKVEKLGVLPDNKGGKMYWRDEDIIAEARKLFKEHGVVSATRVRERQHTVSFVGEGIHTRYRPAVSLLVDVVFTSIEDGSEWHVTVVSEGSDTGGDSGSPKALTQARKQGYIQAFLLAEPGSDTDFVDSGDEGSSEPAQVALAAPTVDALKGKINTGIKSNKTTAQAVSEIGTSLAGEGVENIVWMNDVTVLQGIVTKLGL